MREQQSTCVTTGNFLTQAKAEASAKLESKKFRVLPHSDHPGRWMIATSSLLLTVAIFLHRYRLNVNTCSTRRKAEKREGQHRLRTPHRHTPVGFHQSPRIDIHRWQAYGMLPSRRSKRAPKEISMKPKSRKRVTLFAVAIWVSAGFLDCAMARPTDAAAAAAAKPINAQPTAPIRSAEQLDRYLASADASSPLALLSPASRKRFIQSLRFNATGVTSFTYADIEAELSASQACRLLTLFGIEHTLASMRKIRIENQEDEKAMQSCGATSVQPHSANRPQH